jgi:hypothetical protein
MDNAQLKSLEEILTYLNSIDIAEDPDTFEYLSGIRDQASRIMRDTIQWVERGSL